jgi:tRNA-uridine 2-sulfurtransferase
MKRKTVILAMSGGVDSSVAAYLLKKKGYSVIGMTFKLWKGHECGSHERKNCCSIDSINDAKSACSQLGIPHYVIDYSREFKERVIDSFLSSYRKGSTPNPCIICNTTIKFPLLLEQSRQFDADFIATGHHAICAYSRQHRRFYIKQAKDKNKDQSYVLFGLGQNTLSRLILPTGHFTKDKIRSIAKKLKLKSYNREESQEICFIIDDNLSKFLETNLKEHIKPGCFKDRQGNVLAQHNGTCFYTIGQRRGLKIPYGRPIYVTDIDIETGDISIGEYKDTLKKIVFVEATNWIMPLENIRGMKDITVKIRYKHEKSKADIEFIKGNIIKVIFYSPQSAPTPGQAAVFYKRGIVLGGGWIIRA